ncbi:MAG: MoaD/ThiS family protein [Acetatifactor sp.]|nr:MoaD/ThiS family protein [Acetatifactor sp.]
MDLPEEATVLDALTAYAQKYNAAGVLENRTGIAVVVNGARGSFQRVLRAEDRVRIFKPRIRG